MNRNRRSLEATPTVLEAMARTEAILYGQRAAREHRAAPAAECPRHLRRGFGGWLAAWRVRVSGWKA